MAEHGEVPTSAKCPCCRPGYGAGCRPGQRVGGSGNVDVGLGGGGAFCIVPAAVASFAAVAFRFARALLRLECCTFLYRQRFRCFSGGEAIASTVPASAGTSLTSTVSNNRSSGETDPAANENRLPSCRGITLIDGSCVDKVLQVGESFGVGWVEVAKGG